MPLFSVIIPTFNRRDLLVEAIASVWAQTFKDFEVIVVDDGSTDGTWDYLQSVAGRVVVLRQDNRGPGAARNLGVTRAKGEYIAFLDSDDLWFPWTLQIYYSIINNANYPCFIAGKPLGFSGCASHMQVVEDTLAITYFSDYFASGDVWRWWGVSSFVIPRDKFQEVSGFNDANSNLEDADLALKLGIFPGFVQIVLPSTFAYRIHPGNVTGVISKIIVGARLIVNKERSGLYPGGPPRARERRTIITRHIRPAILECVRAGQLADAWQLYINIWRWNLVEKRLRFLAAIPVLLGWRLMWQRPSAREVSF